MRILKQETLGARNGLEGRTVQSQNKPRICPFIYETPNTLVEWHAFKVLMFIFRHRFNTTTHFVRVALLIFQICISQWSSWDGGVIFPERLETTRWPVARQAWRESCSWEVKVSVDDNRLTDAWHEWDPRLDNCSWRKTHPPGGDRVVARREPRMKQPQHVKVHEVLKEK